MKKRCFRGRPVGVQCPLWLGLFLGAVLVLGPASTVHALSQVKVSVFNFVTLNMEASGYGTTVTNLLTHSLKTDPSLDMLDRKDLEAFLSLHDLQQDDRLEQVISIGTRMGLNVIVAGNVEKKGTIITVQCKVVMVEQKRMVLNSRLKAAGDSDLATEMQKLALQVREAISRNVLTPLAEEQLKAPVRIKSRPGNRQIHLSWEDLPGANADGYEIFRSVSREGPFAKVGQTVPREYLDQNLERSAAYHYKIRAFRNNGLQSGYSAVIAAETALTPHPPIIIKTEAHVRSVHLEWSPNPLPSEDPLKLKGYKLYRAKEERGPYQETADLSDRELSVASDRSSDSLLRVSYRDRNLADGEAHYYKVTAYNEKRIESGFSGAVRGSAWPVVKGLSALGELIREVKLTWSAVDSAFVRGYVIYRSLKPDGDFVKIGIQDASGGEAVRQVQYTDRAGLGDMTRYYYRIAAFEDPGQETSPSDVVSAVTRGRPPVPKDLKASTGLVKKVELSWTEISLEEVEGYKLFWAKAKEGPYRFLKKIEGRANRTYTDSSRDGVPLEDQATYHYTIQAYNRVDVDSESSPAVSATTKARPSRPSNLSGESGKVKSAPLTWLTVPEKDIAFYRVYRKAASGSGPFSDVAGVPAQANRYVDQSLADGEAYLYKIRAEDRDGLWSDFSDEVRVETKPRPRSPQPLSGDYRQGSVELRWNPGPEQDIAHYRIYEKSYWSTEPVPGMDRVPSTSAIFPVPLEKGKKKIYVVTAVDQSGLESAPSPEIAITGP